MNAVKRNANRFASICILSAVILFAFVLLSSCSFRHTGDSDNDDDNPIHSDVVLPGDENSIYNTLHGKVSDSVYVYPSLEHDNVKNMLSSVVPPENFSWYFTSELCSTSDKLSKHGILFYSSGEYRIELYDSNDKLLQVVLTENGKIYCELDGKRSELSVADGENDVFVEAGMVSLNTFLNDTVDEFDYTLVESDYGTLLYAAFSSTKESYSQLQEYYISLDYGVVVRADCYENDMLIYHLETNAIYELETLYSSHADS